MASSSTVLLLRALGELLVRTLPAARAQALRWASCTETFPSPALRQHAHRALHVDDVNVISAAAFALLAPPARRRATIELLMAWRVICSYVDELSEQPSADPLANGLQLHRALVDAVSPSHPLRGSYYAHHPDGDDGGYLDALVAVCRERIGSLPQHDDVESVARFGAERCAEAQSHVHAAAQTGSTQELRRWASQRSIAPGWQWWEVVGASIADLPVMAALAASPVAPARTYAAYQPAALLVSLLDSAVDLDLDAATGDFSLIATYTSDRAARDRLGVIAAAAREAVHTLPVEHVHSAIVAGLVAHYAALPNGRTPRSVELTALARQAMRPTFTPILMTIRGREVVARAPLSPCPQPACVRRVRWRGRGRDRAGP